MGKKLRDEDLVLNIIVNGDQGKKEIGELERAIKDTTSELRALEKTQKTLRAENKEGTKEYKAVTAAIKQKNDAIVLSEARLKQLRQGLDVTRMSYSDLRREMSRLTRLRDLATPMSQQWHNLDAQLQVVQRRFNEVGNNATQTGTNIQNLAGRFNHYIGMITAGFATFSAVIFGVSKSINAFAEFDDKVADVMKTTGLLKEEVLAMNENLKSLDTRTAQNDLLGLDRIAGKLGIEGADNVEGFIRATDKINVALSEDLGGDIEEAINSVGKLVEIFKIDENFTLEQSLLKVGSTINELGAASSANEGYLVDFAKRTAGIAPAAGISITQILGLAATLDQLGQTAEVSSTTFNNMIPKMFTNTEAFAKLAKMSVEDFTELLNRDANEAFIKFLEGVRGNNAGLSEMINNMGDLEIDGARATSVIAVLANNTQMLREQQILGNAAFVEGTSINDEFAIKNSTAAAMLEKARKGLQNLTVELGEKLMPTMTVSISGFSYFVRILSALYDFVSKNKGTIMSLVAAVIAYNTVLFIQNKLSAESILLAKAKIFWTNAVIVAEQLWAATTMLLSGNLKGAAQAMRVLNTVIKANPYALLAAVIIAVGVALYNWTKGLTSAEKAQKALNDVSNDAQKAIVAEKLAVERLIAVAKDKTKSDEDRLLALQKLNQISPEYFSNLNLETINTEAATKATDAYVLALLKKARVQAAEEKMVELEKRRIDLLTDGEEAALSIWQQTKVTALQAMGFAAKAGKLAGEYRAENTKGIADDLNLQSELLEDYIKKNESAAKIVAPAGGGSGEPPAAQTQTLETLKANLSALQDARDKIDVKNIAALQANEKAQRDIQDRIAQYDIKSIDAKNKRVEKQVTKEETEAAKKLADEQEFRKKVLEGDLRLIELENYHHEERLKESGLFGKNKEDMTSEDHQVLLALQRKYYDNISKLDAEALTLHLTKKQVAFERDFQALQAANNEEYKSIKTVEQAKELLREDLSIEALRGIKTMKQAQQELDKKFQREEETMMRQHLEGLLAELQSAVTNGTFDGVNLADSILSEEELAILEEKLAAVKLMLSELGLGSGTEIAEDRGKRTSNVDILGFSPDDWTSFFQNIEAGKIGFEDVAMAAQAMIGAYAQYASFVSAGEQRELQAFQKRTDEKKLHLQSQLDADLISQELYNSQVNALDADLDKKKAVFDRNNAKRERNVALMSAIVNGAVAVNSALTLPPPFGIIMAGIVGAMAALQVGTILKTPLPDIPGAESGGRLKDVRRSQDGKMFRAKSDPKKRGYVDRPTVIVGENGEEMVANADAVRNPTIKPVLDIIDTAQRNGQISSLNLMKVLEQNRAYSMRIPGRQSGGTISGDSARSDFSVSRRRTDEDTNELLRKNYQVQVMLLKRLEKPIKADVSLTGRSGLEEKQDELAAIQSRATI